MNALAAPEWIKSHCHGDQVILTEKNLSRGLSIFAFSREAKPGQMLISPRVFIAIEDAVEVEPVGEPLSGYGRT